MPREFVKDGRQFIARCSKRTYPLGQSLFADSVAHTSDRIACLADVSLATTVANFHPPSQPTSASSCASPRPSAWVS